MSPASPDDLREAGFQFWNVLYIPGFALPTLLFSTLFYVFFGLVFSQGKGGGGATYLLATYGTFGIMAPSLFGDVRLPRNEWFGLLATLIVGTIPFCALGLTIGLHAGDQSSLAIVNLIKGTRLAIRVPSNEQGAPDNSPALRAQSA